MNDRRVELGDLGDLSDGAMRSFPDVGAEGLVVCRAGGVLYALDDRCSHADTKLSEGRMHAHSIVCPLHGAAFDVRDGSHLGPPAWEGVACHRVLESDETAVVEIADEQPQRLADEPRPRMR